MNQIAKVTKTEVPAPVASPTRRADEYKTAVLTLRAKYNLEKARTIEERTRKGDLNNEFPSFWGWILSRLA